MGDINISSDKKKNKLTTLTIVQDFPKKKSDHSSDISMMQGKAKNVDILDEKEYKKQTLTIVQDFRKKKSGEDHDNFEMLQKKEKDMPVVDSAQPKKEDKKDDKKSVVEKKQEPKPTDKIEKGSDGKIELIIGQDFHKKKPTISDTASIQSLSQKKDLKPEERTAEKGFTTE